MKSIDIVDFLHGDNHQGKAENETTCFWLGVVNWASRRIGLHDFLQYLLQYFQYFLQYSLQYL